MQAASPADAGRFRKVGGRAGVGAARQIFADQMAEATVSSRSELIVRAGVPQLVQQVVDRGFTYDEQQQRWVDAKWDGTQRLTQVVVFSDEYFRLLREKPILRRYFALGERVLVVANGRAYETLPPDDAG